MGIRVKHLSIALFALSILGASSSSAAPTLKPGFDIGFFDLKLRSYEGEADAKAPWRYPRT
jgi:hypothetical protein